MFRTNWYKGWKGSTKTLDLVLALRDFYVNHDEYVSSLEAPQTATEGDLSAPQGEDDGRKGGREEIGPNVLKTPGITPEDAWAIEFLSRSHLSPLMEAVDPDFSGHVTIKEINDFTSSRPREWRYSYSLLVYFACFILFYLQPPTVGCILDCWYVKLLNCFIALSNHRKYVGFEVTLRQYCYRIKDLFSRLHSLYDLLIPRNAGVFSSVMAFNIADVIVRIHMIGTDDIEDEYQNQSFRVYVEGIEKQLEERLERLNYLIDDRNTLSLVTGPGRLEEVCGSLSLANFIL